MFVTIIRDQFINFIGIPEFTNFLLSNAANRFGGKIFMQFQCTHISSATQYFKDFTSNMYLTVMASSLLSRKYHLPCEGLNTKRRTLQLEHVSYELCMLKNYVDFAASNSMFLDHPIIVLGFH